MNNQDIYLDNNATTGIDPLVLKEMVTIAQKGPLNPSSIHGYGREAKALLEECRDCVAVYLQKRPEEIFFTSSGTESLNLLIRGLASEKPCSILSSTVEHAAVDNTLNDLKNKGHIIHLLSPLNHQAIKPEQVKEALTNKIDLAIFSWVNGETGLKTDIPAIAALCKEKNIPLVVDGVALMGKENFTIPEGVVGMAFAGHKFHGPKAGITFVQNKVKLLPIITGGHQEHSLRAGTEDLVNIAGIAKAIKLLQTHLPEATEQMLTLRDYFEEKLRLSLGAEINGQGARVCNVSNLFFPNIEAESLLFYLDKNKIYASHGSACASHLLQPSRVLKELGYPKERVLGSIRFSLSRNTTKEQLDKAIECLTKYTPPFC